MGRNKIELWGRLVSAPQLVECGSEGEQLQLGVVMIGDEARASAILTRGREVHVAGRLRSVGRRGRSGLDAAQIEVMAGEVRLAAGEP